MHFPDELTDVSKFAEPQERKIAPAEMKMAKQLIDSMSTKWNPSEYVDDYRDAMEKMIEKKVEQGDSAKPAKFGDDIPKMSSTWYRC